MTCQAIAALDNVKEKKKKTYRQAIKGASFIKTIPCNSLEKDRGAIDTINGAILGTQGLKSTACRLNGSRAPRRTSAAKQFLTSAGKARIYGKLNYKASDMWACHTYAMSVMTRFPMLQFGCTAKQRYAELSTIPRLWGRIGATDKKGG